MAQVIGSGKDSNIKSLLNVLVDETVSSFVLELEVQ